MADKRASLAARLTKLADKSRERGATLRRLTVAVGLLAASVGACGGSRGGDTYARGVDVQRQCCERLAGDPRTTCLADVPRVDDPAVAASEGNQQTFACMVEHFVCDPATGRPTPASAQAQLDCLEDLKR